MPNTFRHHKALTRPKIDNFVFKIDQEMAVEDKEELVDVVMLVPAARPSRSPDKEFGCTICPCTHRPASEHRLLLAVGAEC
jgi:hypothetical protein